MKTTTLCPRGSASKLVSRVDPVRELAVVYHRSTFDKSLPGLSIVSYRGIDRAPPNSLVVEGGSDSKGPMSILLEIEQMS